MEAAKREAESLLREARVTANEESIKLRSQAELAYVTRQQEVAAAEQRLAQRETLITTQLEGFLQREKHIQSQQAALDTREGCLEKARAETDALTRERREQLARVAQLSAEDARAQLLKDCEVTALRDANELSAASSPRRRARPRTPRAASFLSPSSATLRSTRTKPPPQPSR